MGKGGGSTQVKESAAEKAQAQVSKAKWDRYKSLYRPVERNFIDEVSKDTSALLRGRATADVAQAASGSMGDAVALGRGTTNMLGATAENIGGARTMAAVGANKQAQEVKDKGQLSAIAIGNDHSVDVQNGLSMAARAANTEALGKARAQQIENEAYSGALGAIAGGVTAGLMNGNSPFGAKPEPSAWEIKRANAKYSTGIGMNYDSAAANRYKGYA